MLEQRKNAKNSMIVLLKKFLKRIIFMREHKPILKKKDFVKRKLFNVIGGDQNLDKTFYVIQRSPGGGGIFSNLSFVVNHIKIAKKLGYEPIVDMENYPNIYNESEKIFGTYNSWEYYFEQISNYKLKDIYKSKNVFLTDSRFYSDIDFEYNITKSEDLVEIFHKYIKLNKIKLKTLNYLKKKILKNKKVLGVHFRGTGYKIARNPYPATKNQMINKINEIIKKDNYDKIFLMTEDSNNFESIKNYFKEKFIFFNSSIKGKTNLEVFDKYTRKRHRYKLGRNVLYETYLMSYCDGFLDIETNPREIAHLLNLNPKQKRYSIDNGFNYGWGRFFNYLNISWYLKSILPEKFGGFKNNQNPKK